MLFAVKMGPKKFQWHRAESREINSVNKCIGQVPFLAFSFLYFPLSLSFFFTLSFSHQAFDLAYHLWCGSAQKQHETHHAEIHQIESRLKSLENHYRALRRKVDDLKTHQKHQLSMEDTVISSEEERLEIPILPFNRSRRGSRASGLGILGGSLFTDDFFSCRNKVILHPILSPALEATRFHHFGGQTGSAPMK